MGALTGGFRFKVLIYAAVVASRKPTFLDLLKLGLIGGW